MKFTGICPRCRNNRILFLEQARLPSCDSSNGTVPIAPATVETAGWPGGRISSGTMQTAICARCGFVEWYAVGFQQLEQLAQHPASGVRLIVGPPPAPPTRGSRPRKIGHGTRPGRSAARRAAAPRASRRSR